MSGKKFSWASALGIVLLLLASFDIRAAELVVEVFKLRHRTAEQVLPLVQPLVAKPGSIGGAGSDLVFRGSRSELADVRKAITALDRAPKQLVVTVRQDAAADSATSGRSYSTRTADADRSVQQVRTVEGGEASIRVGQSVPVVLRSSSRRMIDGRWVDDSAAVVEYRDIVSGFVVRPRLAGDTVTLDLWPQNDTPGTSGRGSANLQRVATTLSGRVGEWMEVGAVLSGDAPRSDGVTYSTRTASVAARRILVKVEVVD
jgi:type II secretory pathway component GspD/PulD (secretin)